MIYPMVQRSIVLGESGIPRFDVCDADRIAQG